MKHLTEYKLFESSSDDLKLEVLEIYQDFLDHFSLLQSPHHKDWYSNRQVSFGITSDVRFGKGIKVVVKNGDVNGGYLIKETPCKGFAGINNKDIATELEKAHNRCLEHFGFKDYIVGSYYKYQSGGLSIVYYTEPSFIFEGKEFNPEHLYDEDSYIRELSTIKGYLVCKSSHDNIFDYFDNNGNINGMFCLWGGKSPMYYYNPIAITSGRDCDQYGYCIANTPIEQWITKQWSDFCIGYNIPVSNKRWNTSRQQREGDPTVYEFMDYLVENQDDFKNYKQLPKVNKDRR